MSHALRGVWVDSQSYENSNAGEGGEARQSGETGTCTAGMCNSIHKRHKGCWGEVFTWAHGLMKRDLLGKEGGKCSLRVAHSCAGLSLFCRGWCGWQKYVAGMVSVSEVTGSCEGRGLLADHVVCRVGMVSQTRKQLPSGYLSKDASQVASSQAISSKLYDLSSHP